MEPSFLSVDLDYFNHFHAAFLPVMRALRHMNVPVYLVDSHEDVLQYIDGEEFSVVVNVDKHSDLAGHSKEYLESSNHLAHCGDWADFLGHETRTYVWIHPRSGFYSRCDGDASGKFECIKSTYGRVWSTTNYNRILSFETKLVTIALSKIDRYTDSDVFSLVLETEWIRNWFEKIWTKPVSLRNYLED